MESQHDSDHLASSLQISPVIGYKAHQKPINDHTSYTKRMPLTERSLMTIDENSKITNQIAYIITNEIIAVIISITAFQRN